MSLSSVAHGSEAPARWSLRLLGVFELAAMPSGQAIRSLGKKERVLLAYLAVSATGREQRRKLATFLWGDSGDEAALDSLRTSLWRLRKALGDGEHRIVASEGEEIVLDLAAFNVDAIMFRRLVAQSGIEDLQSAAELYSDDFLDGLTVDSEDFEIWRRAESNRYREEAIDVLTRLMKLLGESGEPNKAIEVGNRILRLEPLHDAVVRHLMELYAETGRRGAAIDLYRAHDTALRTELNVKPEVQTREVLAALGNDAPQRERIANTDEQNSEIRPHRTGIPKLPLSASPRLTWRKSKATPWLAGALLALTAVTIVVALTAWGGTPPAPTVRVASAPAGGATIAVLPFLNKSANVSDDFVSGGTSEEIAVALAKIPGVRVVGRSSAFRFKDERRDLQAIGRSLNAPYLLDGTVTRVGTRVSMQVQLLRVQDGLVVWTDTYDREVTEILRLQSEIARAVAHALRAPLGLQPSNRLAIDSTIDVTTYETYLRAKVLLRGVTPGGGVEPALTLLQTVVQQSPDFAPGWAALATAYQLVPVYSTAILTGSDRELRVLTGGSSEKAQDAAQRSVQLDPNLPEGYVALGLAAMRRRDVSKAFEHITTAMSLDPTNADVLGVYRNFLLNAGRVEAALAVQERVVALEPFVPRFQTNLALNLWLAGQDAAAIRILNAPTAKDSQIGHVRLAMIFAAAKEYGKAADVLNAIPPGVFPRSAIQAAVRRLRSAPTPASLNEGPELGVLGFVYLHSGEPSRVVQFYETSMDGSGFLGIAPLWQQAYAPVRKTDRFKELVRKANLPEFWRAHGWPQFCHPVGLTDFACS